MKIKKLNESTIDDLNSLPRERGMSKVSFELVKQYQDTLRQFPIGKVLKHNIDAGEEKFTKVEDGEFGWWEHFRAPWKDTRRVSEFDLAHWLAGREVISRSDIIEENLDTMKIKKLNEDIQQGGDVTIKESLEESVNTNKFKVGDTFTFSGLYGGNYTSKVIAIHPADDSEYEHDCIECETTWTNEDTGKTEVDTDVWELIKDNEGKECIVIWEYAGQKGYVYPPSAQSNSSTVESSLEDKVKQDAKEMYEMGVECNSYEEFAKFMTDNGETPTKDLYNLYVKTLEDAHNGKDKIEEDFGFKSGSKYLGGLPSEPSSLEYGKALNQAYLNSDKFKKEKQDVIDFANACKLDGFPCEDYNEFAKVLADDGIVATNTLWKIYQDTLNGVKESLTEATYCVYFNQDGRDQIEFEGTEDECYDYIASIESEQDDEFGDEAPERFIRRLTESTDNRKTLDESLFEAVEEFPYMFHYNCNNPTFGYDFQQLAKSYGAKKVYGKYKGTGIGRYFYLVPSAGVYDKLLKVAKDKYTVDMQKMLPYDETLYPNVQIMNEAYYGGAFDIADDQLTEELDEAVVFGHNVVKIGDTLTSKSGHKIHIDDMSATLSPFDNNAIVTFHYSYEMTDGTKGSSTCTTYDLKNMLNESLNESSEDINPRTIRNALILSGQAKELLSDITLDAKKELYIDEIITKLANVKSYAKDVIDNFSQEDKEELYKEFDLDKVTFLTEATSLDTYKEDAQLWFGKKLPNICNEVLQNIDIWKDYKVAYFINLAEKFYNEVARYAHQLGEPLTESTIIDAEPIETGAAVGMATIISDLIKDEYEAIDGYNSAIATAEAEGFGDMVNVLTEIQAEENLHIGQLQTLMSTVDPNAHLVDDGKQEGIEQLANPIATEVVEESINANDLSDNAEEAFQNNQLDEFVCDALKDGSATEKDLMLIAIKSSIIEEDDMKRAIANCK